MPSFKIKKPWKNRSYKDRGNPDINKDKHYNMIIDTQAHDGKYSVETEAGTIEFDQGIATLPADTRAKDIVAELREKHAKHPDQFAFLEKRSRINTDPVHRYQIVVPELPWKKEEK